MTKGPHRGPFSFLGLPAIGGAAHDHGFAKLAEAARQLELLHAGGHLRKLLARHAG